MSSPMEVLAAREVRRYFFLRTGKLLRSRPLINCQQATPSWWREKTEHLCQVSLIRT